MSISVSPYLLFEDVPAMLEWLVRTFGFMEKHTQKGADGTVVHAELEFDGGATVMIGCPGPAYKNPKHLGVVTQYLYVQLSDVDSLYARALKAGAESIEAPEDQPYGERRCGLKDPEGHAWYFAEPVSH